MAIPDVTDEDLKKILSENLTPSAAITTPERLFGREKYLRDIDRGLSSPGRQIFIYGDRGVGKTSLALTAAYLHTKGVEPITVLCSKTSTFASVVQAIGNAAIPVTERIDKPDSGGGFSLQVMGTGGSYTTPSKSATVIAPPTSLNEALDIVRYVKERRAGQPIVVIVDELERLESTPEREQFAEFVRNIPTLGDGIKFIFCGIGQDITELLQSHASAGRILETVSLERLSHSDLWKILTRAGEKLGVEVQRESLIRIGQVSDGFPHYVHLIGESMFWSMFDDAGVVKKSDSPHYKAGIEGALRRTEANLKAQYEKATQKYRNTAEYEMALWALADSTSDKRQISEIFDSSYKWISRASSGPGTKLTREKLNQRYLSLRGESHGRVVAGFGAGWFAFRENIMRGYVRLRAESRGVNLGKHNNTSGMD